MSASATPPPSPATSPTPKSRSITLATGSTTGRGLYVGMTRGRQANYVLVITESNDLGAARDLLERVVTCDRADVPAVARRNQLVAYSGLDRSTEVLRRWFDAPDTRPAPS